MGACGSSQVQPGDIETDPIGKGPLAGAAERAYRRPQNFISWPLTLASARPRPQISCARRR